MATHERAGSSPKFTYTDVLLNGDPVALTNDCGGGSAVPPDQIQQYATWYGGWTATASSANPQTATEGPANYALDARPSTLWHSNYTNRQPGVDYLVTVTPPHDITFNRFVYVPRTSGSNGNPAAFRLEYFGGAAWVEAATWTGAGSNSPITLNFPAVTTSQVRVVVTAATGASARRRPSSSTRFPDDWTGSSPARGFRDGRRVMTGCVAVR